MGHEIEYVDVKASRDNLERMLGYDRRRQVPVIVMNGRVTVGHGGT